MNSLDELERTRQLIKDNRLSDAYQNVQSLLASTVDNKPLPPEILSVICALIKALAQAGNYKACDEILLGSISHVAPSEDHLFLKLSDEFVEMGSFSPLNKQENNTRLDKFFDQALKIRKGLIGADGVAAELIIESIFANLQKARQCANAGLSAEAAARLARCRVLMNELDGLMYHLQNPPDLLVARVATLVAFFDQSAGNRTEAKEAYICALQAYGRIAGKDSLERTEILEMFLEQAPLFSLSREQKNIYEKIKRYKAGPRRDGTQHKIKAFPSVDHIQEIMKRAAAKPNKAFSLTSLGFLGSQSLMVSVICHRESGEMTFTIEPSADTGQSNKRIVVETTDAQEVLRHIKDLWKSLQVKAPPFAAGLNPDQFVISQRQASADEMGPDSAFDNFPGPGGGFNSEFSPTYKPKLDLLGNDDAASEFSPGPYHSHNPNPGPRPTQPESLAGGGTSGGFNASGAYYQALPDMSAPRSEDQRLRETLIFEGNLKTMPTLGLIQTISLNGNTGVLEVSGKDGIMSIFFDNGKPVHAQSLTTSGVDALYDFIMQEEGWFRFLPERRAPLVTIKLRFESFLLDAATLFDESKYLKSLGLTMYSGLFPRRFCSDRQELTTMLDRKGVELDNDMWELYIALSENPIVSNAVDLTGMPRRIWIHALYKLVQSGTVNVSNDGMDDEELSQRLTTAWTYDASKIESFATSLQDNHTSLLREDFIIWILEREFERARTQMVPLSFVAFEIRKGGALYSELSLPDKAAVKMTLNQISEAKRSIDWFGHLDDDMFVFIMPGLDSGLAAMFAKDFTEICSRSLGKMREGQSDWEYSMGIASIPQDTFEWQKMVGYALEAQRKARMARSGFVAHQVDEPTA